jgi:hypothetical protein
MKILRNMVDAVPVQFVKPIFEDDFVEIGMKAWLTRFEYDLEKDPELIQLFFDFSDFEKENMKYFRETYYGNRYTKEIEEKTGRSLFTAIETGNYSPKYSVWATIKPLREGLFISALREIGV